MTNTVTPMMTTSQNNPSITRSRTGLILALALLLAAPVFAQTGTVAPVARQQFLDNSGNPLSGGKLYTFASGTSTPLATYTSAALNVANTNPIVLDSAGRATIFLTTASYKFVLATSADVVVWTVDNVSSVAPFNVDLDVTGVAGESLTAGDLVYLSDGTGGNTPGRWYKTDADLTYASVRAAELGFVTADVDAGNSASIRQAGRVTGLTSLSVGQDYYISATAGALVATAPANGVRVGRADSSTSLILGNFAVPAMPREPCGRLSLSSDAPVTSGDVTAATTLYFTLYGGCNQVYLYSGTAWNPYTISELSVAVPATTNTMYDVFAYDNAGAVALELLAWTNDTTRATALIKQNGVYVKTGATTRLYLGSFRTTAVSGQTEDSLAKRLVWNYYHRQPRMMRRVEATDSWNYTVATWRQANATAANQVEFVVGVPEVVFDATITAFALNSGGTCVASVAVGLDSTTAPTTGNIGMLLNNTTAVQANVGVARFRSMPAAGYHYAAWLEYSSTTTGTTTFYGDIGGAITQAGLDAVIQGE